MLVTQTKVNFYICITKINTKLFFYCTNLPLMSSVGPSPTISMRWWIIVNIKNYNIPNKINTKTPRSCTIKRYSIAAIQLLTFITISYYIRGTKQAFSLFLYLIHRQFKHLQFWSRYYFVLQQKQSYWILFLSYIQKALCYARTQYTMV